MDDLSWVRAVSVTEKHVRLTGPAQSLLRKPKVKELKKSLEFLSTHVSVRRVVQNKGEPEWLVDVDISRIKRSDKRLAEALRLVSATSFRSWVHPLSLRIADGCLHICASSSLPQVSGMTLHALEGTSVLASAEAVPSVVKGKDAWLCSLPLDSLAPHDAASWRSLNFQMSVQAAGLYGDSLSFCICLDDFCVPSSVCAHYVSSRCVDEPFAVVPFIGKKGYVRLALAGFDACPGTDSLPRKHAVLPLSCELAAALVETQPRLVSEVYGFSARELASRVLLNEAQASFVDASGEVHALRAQPLQVVCNEKALCVELASWIGSRMVFTLHHPRIPDWACAQECWKVAFYTQDGGNFVRAVPAHMVQGGEKSYWFVSVDATEFGSCVTSHEALCLKMKLVYEGEGGTWVSASLGPKRAKGSFAQFIEGFYRGEDFALLPDESKEKQFVLRLIGRKENVSEQGWVGLKKRALTNRALFFAASQGPQVFNAVLDALADGTLTTRIIPEAFDKVMCECSAGDTKLLLDISDLSRAKNATLLNRDCSYEYLDYNEVPDLLFGTLYKMLVEIDELCQKHDITYYLAGGTLLGAIRHKGFIPWDHDIDVYMSFEDFCRFSDIVNSDEGPKDRQVDSIERIENYELPIARYMNSASTRFNPVMQRGAGGIGGAGIFIDIFIISPMKGEGRREAFDHFADFLVYEELRNKYKLAMPERDAVYTEKLKRAVAQWDAEGYEASLAYWKEQSDSGFAEESRFQFFRTSTSMSAHGRLFNEGDFSSVERIDLLGHDFNIAVGARDILRDDYGYAWRLYPDNRYIPRDTNLYNSLKVPYRVLVEEGLKDVSEEEYLAKRFAHKRDQIDNILVRMRSWDARTKLIQHYVRFTIDAALREGALDLADCLAQGRWEELDKVFSVLYSMMHMRGFRRIHRYIPLSSQELSAAVRCALCYRDDLKLALALVGAHVHYVVDLNDEEQRIVELVDSLSHFYDAVELGDRVRAHELYERICTLEPQLQFLSRHGRYAAAVEGSCETDEVKEALQEAKDRFERNNDKASLYVMASCLELLGELDAAYAIYGYVREYSLDGVVLTAIEERIGAEGGVRTHGSH